MANRDTAVTRLVVLGATGIEPLLLVRQQMVVGHPSTTAFFLDGSVVSRRHALITFSPSGQVSVHDLKCAGGTFVNDERIAGPRALRAGDLVKFADLVTRFEVPQPADDGPPAPDLPATELPIPAQAGLVPLAPAARPELPAGGGDGNLVQPTRITMNPVTGILTPGNVPITGAAEAGARGAGGVQGSTYG
jgi:hypothetical protein